MTTAHGTTTARRTAGRVAREVVLVANANASGASGGRSPDRVAAELRALGARVELLRTRSPGEMADAWRREPGRLVVLLGGDGTLHAAVNLPGPAPEVALIPAGRANNVARCLGIPVSPPQAARTALEGRARPVDLIECRAGASRIVAVEGLSVGFLALARHRYHSRNSADVTAAVAAGAAALVHFHPLDVRLTEHGRPGMVHVGQLFVANMQCFGTGLRVAPHADPRDGLLDVVAIDIPGRRAIPAMLLRLRRGTHLRHRGVRRWRATEITIETRGTSPVMADAEELGSGPVEVRALRGALDVVVPAQPCD
ncbi:diacylglycerol/lipid kinase family protein [Miltoncostaea marina]|uniref:diacylglycerol/lipid kinase family protein n=1 Tax=Miltoncostaea marina TaxID=2843215 RepID=UPI001C3D9B24|nr:diacylglycerol kinase family protein [Miltoncostaea marina]